MKFLDTLRSALAGVFQDLFGEDLPLSSTRPAFSQAESLLAEVRAQFAELQTSHNQAVIREKRAELEWRQATAEAQALDEEIDRALLAGDEAKARSQTERLHRLQALGIDLEGRYQACAQVSQALQGELDIVQRNIEDVRRKLDEYHDRQQAVESLEQITQLRRKLRRDLASFDDELSQRKEQVARLEDRLAARRELDQP